MRKLFTFFFLLTTSALVAQELTADTPAVASTWLDYVWSVLIAAIAWSARNAGPLILKAQELLTVYLKAWMHFRGSDVVADTVAQLMVGRLEHLRKALLDGTITRDELNEIKQEAVKDAVAKLKNLFGFIKPDLEAWATEQVGITLGKLLFRGYNASGLKTS